MPKKTLTIPSSYARFIPDAIVRLGYLHPEVKWRPLGNGSDITEVEVSGEELDEMQLQKELMYQLYRQRCHEETNPVRGWLYHDPSRD